MDIGTCNWLKANRLETEHILKPPCACKKCVTAKLQNKSQSLTLHEQDAFYENTMFLRRTNLDMALKADEEGITFRGQNHGPRKWPLPVSQGNPHCQRGFAMPIKQDLITVCCHSHFSLFWMGIFIAVLLSLLQYIMCMFLCVLLGKIAGNN